jgi:PIN domain nuclease of toxin-antitoxin system
MKWRGDRHRSGFGTEGTAGSSLQSAGRAEARSSQGTADHAVRAGILPGPHKDPFDRMLIAQAQAENMAVVSNDEVFDNYGVTRIW